MSISDSLTPAQVASLDQERGEIRNVLTQCVKVVADHMQEHGDNLDTSELFCSLVKEFYLMDGTRTLAIFTEAIIRLARMEKRNG